MSDSDGVTGKYCSRLPIQLDLPYDLSNIRLLKKDDKMHLGQKGFAHDLCKKDLCKELTCQYNR